jgi:hypothetical protein
MREAEKHGAGADLASGSRFLLPFSFLCHGQGSCLVYHQWLKSRSSEHHEMFDSLRHLFNGLLCASVAAILIGVVLENTRFSHPVQELGWKILIGGLGIELLLSAGLWQLDSSVDRKQKSEIASLNDRIASVNSANALLNAKTAALNAEIQPRDLTDIEIERIISAVSPFHGKHVLIQSYVGDTEGHSLLFLLAQVLGKAGLNVDVGYWYPDTSPKMQYLLGIEVSAPRQVVTSPKCSKTL